MDGALDWAASVGPDERAFLYVHSLNPHNPYSRPASPNALGGPDRSSLGGDTVTLVQIRGGEVRPSESDRRHLVRLYAAGVAYADAELGRLVSELRRSFGAEDVLVVASRNGRTGGMGFRRGRAWDPEAFFDLERDPGESRNLAGKDGVERSWLRAHARQWSRGLRSEVDAPGPGVGVETRERLRALGYVE